MMFLGRKYVNHWGGSPLSICTNRSYMYRCTSMVNHFWTWIRLICNIIWLWHCIWYHLISYLIHKIVWNSNCEHIFEFHICDLRPSEESCKQTENGGLKKIRCRCPCLFFFFKPCMRGRSCHNQRVPSRPRTQVDSPKKLISLGGQSYCIFWFS